MRSNTFILFLVATFVGFSTVSYGAWKKYVRGDGQVPDGDCLEMICQYGCAEKDGSSGYCCGAGKKGDRCYGGLCCDVSKNLICSSETSAGTCTCPTGTEWNGTSCCVNDTGCGCGVEKVDGCCPGEVNVGCGCGVAKVDGCCPGVINVGCGCGVAKVDGCCPGEVNVGCGCGVAKVDGCCPGVVKGCDGVCGSGKVKGCDGVCGSGKKNCGGGGLVARPCAFCGG